MGHKLKCIWLNKLEKGLFQVKSKVLISVFIVLTLYSCDKTGTSLANKFDMDAEHHVSNLNYVNSKYLDGLEIGKDLFSMGDLSGHRFGSFYGENISFYIVEDIELSLDGKVYESSLVLCFINEILYKKKYTLSSLNLEDFLKHYNCEKLLDEQEKKKFNLERFYKMRLNIVDSKVTLKKEDYDRYAIEEYHEYFPQAWQLAVNY